MARRSHARGAIVRIDPVESLRVVSDVPVAVGPPYYHVTVERHIDAMDDAETLHGSVLVHSYTLVEGGAVGDRPAIARRDRGFWGARLLSTNDRDWTDVTGGLAGAVELAVVRNAIAHGSRTIHAAARARLLAAGARVNPVGSAVTLTYAHCASSEAAS
jgi:hypothetical protein